MEALEQVCLEGSRDPRKYKWVLERLPHSTSLWGRCGEFQDPLDPFSAEAGTRGTPAVPGPGGGSG